MTKPKNPVPFGGDGFRWPQMILRDRVRTLGVVATISIISLVGLLIWSAVESPQRDPLGHVGPFYIPVQVPSSDPSVRRYVMNNQAYAVPRNYIVSLSNNDDGTVGAISMAALLPELAGLTQPKMRCLNF